MLWRVRTTLADRPGILAEIALACGRAEVNILALQVFPTSLRVTDELVVSAPEGWTDVMVARLFEEAGGSDVSATRVSDASVADAPTRYLRGVHEVLEEGRDVVSVLQELLETEPPDVADYAGHDVLELLDDTWTFQLIVEDAWQKRGLGTRLMRVAAGHAKESGAARLTFVTAGSNDRLLRAVGRAGFVARVERHDGNVHVTVPLRDVRAAAATGSG